MKWQPDTSLSISIDGVRLEARCWGPAPRDSPSIVLLHEGLGSVGLWKDFPRDLARRTGHGVFAHSRAGYGNSDPAALPRPLDYMTREALDVLPKLLDGIGFRNGILLGHSDGASIATIYAGSVQDFRVRGLCLISPHFFTEPHGLASIAEAKTAYEEDSKFRVRLARRHADPENAFRGWNDAWLDPGFEAWNIEETIPYVRVPVLVIQGRDDQYGTMAQIEALGNGLHSPLDVEVFDGCRHSPHIEKPRETLAAVSEFVARLDRIEAAKAETG
ncbi:MAG: alpha/beta fold hydrolase [Paracoccaceae bacterium]